jgi:nucleotide-binding universal stress UspA family protein
MAEEHWKPATILVALDEHEHRHEVVDAGLELAESEGGEAIFLNVVSPHDPRIIQLGPGAMLAPQRLAVGPGDVVLREAEQAARQRGVPCQLLLISGDPGEQIVAVAEEVDADLIVIGSHTDHRTLVGFLFGDVSRDVVKHAKRSVLVYRRAPEGGSAPAEGKPADE